MTTYGNPRHETRMAIIQDRLNDYWVERGIEIPDEITYDLLLHLLMLSMKFRGKQDDCARCVRDHLSEDICPGDPDDPNQPQLHTCGRPNKNPW